jgi:hypothetical protein
MNARRSPSWILSHHTEDQGADLFGDRLPSSYLADSGDPRPIQTKSRSVPVHDGSRSDQDERLSPPGPAHSQRNPEQFVQGSQSTARSLRVQCQQLPTKSQVFEHEVLAGTESAGYPAEEMSEQHDHGKNSSGKDRIKLCAKSFISLVYDLLARHNSGRSGSTDHTGRRTSLIKLCVPRVRYGWRTLAGPEKRPRQLSASKPWPGLPGWSRHRRRSPRRLQSAARPWGFQFVSQVHPTD